MEILKIEPTKNSPMVELTPDGEMILKGRSVMEDPVIFYNKIIEWISLCQSKMFTFEVRFEYINTSSTKLIISLLKAIKTHYNTNNIVIKWYYESDDEDMLDLGRDFESLVSIPIDYYELQTDDE